MSSSQVQHQRQVQEVENWWRAKAEEEQRVLYARICELEQMLLMSRAGGDCFVWRAWLISAAPGRLAGKRQRQYLFQPGTLIREVAKQHGVSDGVVLAFNKMSFDWMIINVDHWIVSTKIYIRIVWRELFKLISFCEARPRGQSYVLSGNCCFVLADKKEELQIIFSHIL